MYCSSAKHLQFSNPLERLSTAILLGASYGERSEQKPFLRQGFGRLVELTGQARYHQ